jgi:uncharacterized protein YlxW (UPF0749 family)
MTSKLKIIFVVIGCFIGLITTSQLASNVDLSGSFPYDLIQARQEFLQDLSEEQNLLQNRISLLREQINELNESRIFDESDGSLERLDHLKRRVGLQTQNGAGLLIVLDDGDLAGLNEDNLSEGLIHAADLRDLINILRSAGAKSLAVNNQRIIASSTISSVGSNILVNNVAVQAPYNVFAIGDQDTLVSRMQSADVLIDLKKRFSDKKINLTIQTKDYITIPIYNGSFRTKFIENQIQ